MKKWIDPNTIIGSPAQGSHYLHRQEIEDEFWKNIKKGSHLLFVAPRRVGKTSVMQYQEANPMPGNVCLYENIESVKSKNELFKRLFEMVLKCANNSGKVTSWIKGVVSKYSITDISVSGAIKIGRKDIDFSVEFWALLDSFKKEMKDTIVLFLDEFPEVINKLVKAGKTEEAGDILHSLRELRHDKSFKHFKMVIAGSIGLHYLVKRVDRPKLINDIAPQHIPPLTQPEAVELIAQLTHGATVQYNAVQTELVLKKVVHYLPYHLQLMLDEINRLAKAEGKPDVTEKIVDTAFKNIVKVNKNFEDWMIRLKDTYLGDYKFINEVLCECARNNQLAIQQIMDIAAKHNLDNDFINLLDDLCADGYLSEDDDRIYRFISPFLQQYWIRKNPTR